MGVVQADDAPQEPRKRTFRKFTFRGVDLEQLLDLPTDKLVDLFHARARRRFQRGLKRKPLALIKKLRKAVRDQLSTSPCRDRAEDLLNGWTKRPVEALSLHPTSSRLLSPNPHPRTERSNRRQAPGLELWR